MKKIIILIFVSFSLLYSQDKEPSPWELFIWGSSSVQRSFSPDSFKQKSMITGFQWGSTLGMNNALLNNASGCSSYPKVTAGSRTYPLQLTIQPTWWDATSYVIGAWGAPFMQYEPTLPLTTQNFGTILRPSDSSNQCFGFL